MANGISNITSGIRPIPLVPGGGKSSEGDAKISFGELLNQALDSVNQAQNDTSKMGELYAAGEVDDLHTLMIESEKSGLALQFTLQVRNKILDAYNEIMRMQI